MPASPCPTREASRCTSRSVSAASACTRASGTSSAPGTTSAGGNSRCASAPPRLRSRAPCPRRSAIPPGARRWRRAPRAEPDLFLLLLGLFLLGLLVLVVLVERAAGSALLSADDRTAGAAHQRSLRLAVMLLRRLLLGRAPLRFRIFGARGSGGGDEQRGARERRNQPHLARHERHRHALWESVLRF